jgi:hypothetical protein
MFYLYLVNYKRTQFMLRKEQNHIHLEYFKDILLMSMKDYPDCNNFHLS